MFAVCLFGVNLYYSRVTYSTLRESVRLRFENAALVDQLKVERDRAETANLAKSKFLAAASHDLRQPLHALGLFLDSLERSTLSSPVSAQQVTVLGHARMASAAASEMLTTLLDYSRLDAGVVKAQAAPFAVQPLLRSLEQEFGVQADASSLVYRTRETTAAALADKALVDLVMRNLISNALRYTQAGGVLVACRVRAGRLALEVWDTGCGIATEHLEEIFEEFHQLGNPERDRRKGLGLGLAISRRLVQEMQARIEVRSRAGRGSVFRLWLPVWSGALEDKASTRQPAVADHGLAGRRILVIDDDEAVRQGMQSLLESWGGLCMCAESAADAQAKLRDIPPPDVIVTDFRLRNEETGKQALQILRDHLQRPVPAIIMTGDTSPQRLRDARSTSALLLHKPVSTRQLREALDRALIPR
ncbi:hybrid sensor histidine kinase/response regulator [Ottowia sp. VDI28]|uniref:hybrid sensor histidine kinase/response regulator n=1 Tax=Ottowia sp. VDI28 TaxID=3133968 RepID=UPI003C2E6823